MVPCDDENMDMDEGVSTGIKISKYNINTTSIKSPKIKNNLTSKSITAKI